MRRVAVIVVAMAVVLAAGTVIARAGITVTPYEYNLGTTEWTTDTAAIGSSSLQLNDPGNTINYAGVLITDLGDPKVEDFAGWSYWTRGPQFHGVNVRMWLDTPYDNYPGQDWDVALNIMPYNMMGADTIPDDTWVYLDSSSAYPYQFFAWDGSGTYLGGNDISMWPDGTTWSEFQAIDSWFAHVDWGTWDYTYDFSQAIIKRVSIRMGGGGHVADHTGYLDDFTLNGVPVQLEDGITVIPEPASLIIWGLLSFAAAGLGVWGRRRAPQWLGGVQSQGRWTEENRQAIRQIVDRGRLNR